MAVIETKFSIGDIVYRASTQTTTKHHPCPDCKGTQKWKAISPAGSEYEFTCPRCSTSFQSNSDLSLRYTSFEPYVTKLTIGSVQYNSAPSSWPDAGASYMCHETGVGGGSVYREHEFHHTHEEAQVAAQAIAQAQNVSVEWAAKLYDKTLSLSDYELTNAEREANRMAHSAVMQNIRNFFDDFEFTDDADAMRKLVAEFREAA